MLTLRCLIISTFLLLHLTCFGQISLSFGVSNTFATGNEFDSGGSGWLGDIREVSSIRENYIVDSYSLGVDFKQEKSNLLLDVTFNTDKLSVSAYRAYYNGHQNGVKTYKYLNSYSVDYGYLGLRVSNLHVLLQNQRLSFSLGQMAQFQVKLFENESDHYDSTFYSSSYNNYWGQSNGYYEESSANYEEFEGMSMSDLSISLGASMSTSYNFNKFQLSLFVNGGLAIRSRADFSTGSKLSTGLFHGFLEFGSKFSYRLSKKSPLE